MDNDNKIKLLENVFEVEEGEITPDLLLDDMENWDSVTKLALIVMVEDEYGKLLSSDNIRSFNCIKDIMAYMEQ